MIGKQWLIIGCIDERTYMYIDVQAIPYALFFYKNNIVSYPSLLILNFVAEFKSIENLLFYFQTITERKIENKKFGGKKGFLSFYSVCMYLVCLCVCLSVDTLQASSFNIGG